MAAINPGILSFPVVYKTGATHNTLHYRDTCSKNAHTEIDTKDNPLIKCHSWLFPIPSYSLLLMFYLSVFPKTPSSSRMRTPVFPVSSRSLFRDNLLTPVA